MCPFVNFNCDTAIGFIFFLLWKNEVGKKTYCNVIRNGEKEKNLQKRISVLF